MDLDYAEEDEFFELTYGSEEEYDALNEETFGNCGGVFSWEEVHQSSLSHALRNGNAVGGKDSPAPEGAALPPEDNSNSWEQRSVKLAMEDVGGEASDEAEDEPSNFRSNCYFIPPQIAQKVPPQPPPFVKNPMTLEEVERELLGDVRKPSLHPVKFFHHLKPTVDVIEQEIFQQAQSPRRLESMPPSEERNQVARHFYPQPPHGHQFPPQILPPDVRMQNWFRLHLPLQCQPRMMMMPMPPIAPPRLPQLFSHNIPPPPGFKPFNTPTTYNYHYNPYHNRIMMTERDKQRFRNIQILQLQSDHPESTDYYNLMYKAKLLAFGGGSHALEPILGKLYPPRAQLESTAEEQKREYKPTQFENCLGQLHACSSLAPRRIMDTNIVRVTECSSSSSCQRRHVLLEIEKLYKCLLIMEEAYIRKNILSNAEKGRNQALEEATEKVQKLLVKTDDLMRILSVSKGKMLVCRALPFLDSPEKYKILAYLLYLFPLWGGDPDVEKFALPCLKHCILNAQDIVDLITVVCEVTTDNQEIFERLVTYKLGITLLICIYHQAEHLLVTRCDPMIVDDVALIWTRKSMAGIAALIEKNERVAVPMEFFPNILHHIRRFPFQEMDSQAIRQIFQRWWLHAQQQINDLRPSCPN